MKPVFRRPWFGLLLVVFLAGCGGGGSGDGTSIDGSGDGTSPIVALPADVPVATTGLPDTPSVPPTPSIARLSGTLTFDSVPNPSGPLVYAATVRKPIRAAIVDVVSSSDEVIASTVTDDVGHYAVEFPGDQMVKVQIRAEMIKSGGGPSWNVSIRDNTAEGSLYVLETGLLFAGNGAVTRNVHVPSGWTGTHYVDDARYAAPFATMDVVYTAMKKAMSADPLLAFPTLRVYWSVNNVPADGDVALGEIGATNFLATTDGVGQIAVLGKQDVDTDEYDESVIAHEWGHYYQWAFSRDDSPGGPHSVDDRLDARLAFSEGWGNAWSGMALARSNYADSYGLAQGKGLDIGFASGPTSNPGWFNELSIQSVLWNLHRLVGFRYIHQAMIGPLKTDPALTTIHAFFSALRTVSSASSVSLGTLLTAQNIHATAGDSFGTGETNAGGLPAVPTALPIYTPTQVGTTKSACVSNVAGEWNKLGNTAYVLFNAPTARNYSIRVEGPAGSDPDFDLFETGLLSTYARDGTTESVTRPLAAGVHVLSITDYANSGAQTCFDVTIQ